MREAVYNFLLLYANCTNFFIVTVSAMALLFLFWYIFSFRGLGTLKKINNILRTEQGQDILLKIEALRLPKRFNNMWEEYYAAYTSGRTASLHNYLIKNDMLVPAGICRNISRCGAACGFAVGSVIVYKINDLPVQEKPGLIYLLICLTAAAFFFDALYCLVSKIRTRRLLYLLEEFKMLSLCSLPGSGADFSQLYDMDKLNELENKINSVRSSCNQLNARFDKLYDSMYPKTDSTQE